MRCKECGYESEEMYYTIQRLKREIEELKKENNKLDLELDSAKWKIKYELEPRLQRERNSYDAWVADLGNEEDNND